VGLPRYAHQFRSYGGAGVDGSVLLLADDEWLSEELHVESQDDRQTILRHVAVLSQRRSECPMWLRRVFISPITEAWSCGWSALKCFFTFRWVSCFKVRADYSLWCKW